MWKSPASWLLPPKHSKAYLERNVDSRVFFRSLLASDSVARRRARESRNTPGRSQRRLTIACKPAGSTIRAVRLIFNARGTSGIAEAVEPASAPFAQRQPAIDVLAVAPGAGREAPYVDIAAVHFARRPVRDLAGRVVDHLIDNQLDFPKPRPRKIKRGPVARAPVRGLFTQRPPLWDRCFISKSGGSPTPRLPVA